jgi:hypothetical protein
MSPRALRASATARRVVVEDRVDVSSEPVGRDRRGTSERGNGRLGCDEWARAQWRQLAHRHAIARYDESLPTVERSHDVTAAVPELPLRDLTRHGRSVARVLQDQTGAQRLERASRSDFLSF